MFVTMQYNFHEVVVVVVIIIIHSPFEMMRRRGYGLHDRMIGVRFPAGAVNFSLQHHAQTGSGVHPTSYPKGTSGSFPEGKEDEA
jgi:hypothetical protein